MKFKYQEKVQLKAEEFINSLKKWGIEAHVLDDSFRDYTVKLNITKDGMAYGKINIYYKPSTETYSFSAHEIKDTEVIPLLEQAWYGRARHHEYPGYQIYVDGTFINHTIGYGVVILKDGVAVQELCGFVEQEDTSRDNRNVAGELAAVQKAIAWCREQGVTVATVFYDYKGIEKWTTGEWKTKQPLTRNYADEMGHCGIKITWSKVQGHTGDRWTNGPMPWPGREPSKTV